MNCLTKLSNKKENTMKNIRTYLNKKSRFSAVLFILLAGVLAGQLFALEMTEAIYGNSKLGEETTVKDSLADADFKLRKLEPKHPLYFEMPEVDDALISSMNSLKAQEWTVPTTAMKMKLIPAGQFVMGSPEGEMYHKENEMQRNVTISKPFYMGTYEVTQRQFYYLTIPDYNFRGWKFRRGPLHVGASFNFRTVLGWGKWLDPSIELLLDNPMDCVSWATAVKYCKRLTDFERQAGRLPKGYEYRLPTEAEWEYACRAGTTGCFNTDAKIEDFLKLKDTKLKEFAQTGGGAGKVGDSKGNKFGLFDMHGNVSEWTLDTYAPYKPGDTADPVNLKNQPGQDVYIDEKVTRGGSYQLFNPRLKPKEKIEDKLDEFLHFRTLRSASRNSIPYDFDFNMTVGFRVVLAPEINVPIPEAANKE